MAPAFTTPGRRVTGGLNLTAQALVRVVRAVFPSLNDWLNGLPDPRLQELCLYAAAHLWWQIIATCLSRQGSRNGFDQQRQSGAAAWNLARIFHIGINQRSGESVQRLEIIKPNENARHRFFDDRL